MQTHFNTVSCITATALITHFFWKFTTINGDWFVSEKGRWQLKGQRTTASISSVAWAPREHHGNWYKSTDDNKIWLHVCEKFNLQLSLGNLVNLNSYLTFIDIRMTLTFITNSKHTLVHSKIVQQWSVIVFWEVFTTVNVCTNISPHLWWRAFLAWRHFWHRLKQFYPDMKDFVQFW